MAKKKVRMLVDHPMGEYVYRCNAVVEFEASLASSLVKAGVADDSKDAVEYALSESGGECLKHAEAVEEPGAGDDQS